jgi:hypothetical protein
MGRPAVCGFTNLAIDSGDDLAFAIIRQIKPTYGISMHPMSIYDMVTPFFYGTWCDDGYVNPDPGEHERLSTILSTILSTTDLMVGKNDLMVTILEDGDINCRGFPEGYFPWMIRRDVLDDLLPTLTYEDGTTGPNGKYVRKRTPIIEDEYSAKREVDRRLQLALDVKGLDRTNAFIKSMDENKEWKRVSGKMEIMLMPELGFKHMFTSSGPMDMGEGRNNYPALQALCSRLDAAIKEEGVTLQDLQAISDTWYPIQRVVGAMTLSRRAFFPHYSVGMQRFDGDNHIAIAKFVTEICDKVAAEEAADRATYE